MKQNGLIYTQQISDLTLFNLCMFNTMHTIIYTSIDIRPCTYFFVVFQIKFHYAILLNLGKSTVTGIYQAVS